MTTNSDVRTTCITTWPDSNGNPLVLVVKDNYESFYSFIFRLLDVKTGRRETVYEAPVWLTSMWRSPGGAIFAVDSDGAVHSNETGTFTATDTASGPGLTWIWGLDDDHVFACGRGGTVIRKAGAEWFHFDDNVDGDLYEIHGTGVNDLYVVGEAGRIFHYDGATWERIEPPTNYQLRSVFCRTPDLVYICGEGGMVFEGARSRWRRLKAPAVKFSSLAEFQGRMYVAAGAAGVFAIEGDEVALIRKSRTYYELVGSPNILFATGDEFSGRFDGSEWAANQFF